MCQKHQVRAAQESCTKLMFKICNQIIKCIQQMINTFPESQQTQALPSLYQTNYCASKHQNQTNPFFYTGFSEFVLINVGENRTWNKIHTHISKCFRHTKYLCKIKVHIGRGLCRCLCYLLCGQKVQYAKQCPPPSPPQTGADG